MALEFQPGTEEYGHVCPLPLPVDPDIPEGHACECGRRWIFRPAHWDPLLTLEELRRRQEAGEFLRGIIPRFKPKETAADSAVIVPMPSPRVESPLG